MVTGNQQMHERLAGLPRVEATHRVAIGRWLLLLRLPDRCRIKLWHIGGSARFRQFLPYLGSCGLHLGVGKRFGGHLFRLYSFNIVCFEVPA